jgi:pentatricopeptide repeat protein
MVKGIERCGEAVGTEAKSAILAGLSLAGRLDEAIGLYAEIKKEGVLPTAYAVSSLMVWSLKFPHSSLFCLLLLWHPPTSGWATEVQLANSSPLFGTADTECA